MKTLRKFLILVLCFSPFLGQAQFVPKKTTPTTVKNPVKLSNKINIKSNIPTLKKVSLKKLQATKTNLTNLKPLNIDKELLMRSSRKNWRITPKKPYDNELSFSFFGNYSTEAFTVSPRLSGETNNTHSPNTYYSYSSFISFNAGANKEYRVKIELKDVVGNGTIIIDNQTSAVSSNNNTINFVFTTDHNGLHIIGLSPYKRNGAVNPQDFKITSVQIDEIGE